MLACHFLFTDLETRSGPRKGEFNSDAQWKPLDADVAISPGVVVWRR